MCVLGKEEDEGEGKKEKEDRFFFSFFLKLGKINEYGDPVLIAVYGIMRFA